MYWFWSFLNFFNFPLDLLGHEYFLHVYAHLKNFVKVYRESVCAFYISFFLFFWIRCYIYLTVFSFVIVFCRDLLFLCSLDVQLFILRFPLIWIQVQLVLVHRFCNIFCDRCRSTLLKLYTTHIFDLILLDERNPEMSFSCFKIFS